MCTEWNVVFLGHLNSTTFHTTREMYLWEIEIAKKYLIRWKYKREASEFLDADENVDYTIFSCD